MGSKMNFLNWLVSRIKEPSTMAGISCIGVILGLPPHALELGTQVLVGIASAAAILLPESRK